MMKIKLVAVGVILGAILAAALYLRFAGVTHERVGETVVEESGRIRAQVDDRCRALDQKLDDRCDVLERKLNRIEGKLDRLLEIANRPLPDNLQRVQ